jgi:hypothetical protein
MSKTAEIALDNLCRSMGRQEQMDQRRAMERACDTQTLRDIVADNRVSVHLPADPNAKVTPQGAGRVVDGETPQNRSGWADSPRLRQPDGVNYIDAMCDQADAIDRAERLRQLAQTAAVRKAEAELAAKQPEPKEGKGPKK